MGTNLTIEAITNIVDFFETSQGLIPKADIPLQYDVHSMRLTNQPDVHKTEIDEMRQELSTLKASINVLAPKRRRIETPQEKSMNAAKNLNARRSIKPRRRFQQPEKMDTSENSLIIPPKNVPNKQKRSFDSSNSSNQYSYSAPSTSQNPTQSQNPQRSKPPRFSQPRQGYGTQNSVSSTTPSQYRSLNYYKPRNSYNNNYNQYNRSRSKSPYRGRSQYGNSQYRGRSPYRSNSRARKSYNFKGKKHDVSLNFYKCGICPDAHENGTSCTTFKALPYNPNE
jgi:hypothetical protein